MVSMCNGVVKILVELFLQTFLANRGSSQGGLLEASIGLVRKHLVSPMMLWHVTLLLVLLLITFFFHGTHCLNLTWDDTVWNS